MLRQALRGRRRTRQPKVREAGESWIRDPTEMLSLADTAGSADASCRFVLTLLLSDHGLAVASRRPPFSERAQVAGPRTPLSTAPQID